MVGLEPTRGHPRKILSLVRLPFRHIRKSCPNNSYFSSRKLFYHTCLEIATLFYFFISKILTQAPKGNISYLNKKRKAILAFFVCLVPMDGLEPS